MPERSPLPEPSAETIAIHTGHALQRWGPDAITAPGGLGGPETAVVRVAEHLVRLGHRVAVYGSMTEEVTRAGVAYRTLPSWDPAVHRRAVILTRELKTLDGPIDADIMVLWIHDHSFGADLSEERAAKLDAALVLSDWHEAAIRDQYAFLPPDFLHRVRDGIEPSFFTGPDLPAVEHDPARVLFTTAPERGLAFLLELWPRVLERVPDATFAFCSADTMSTLLKRYPILGGFRKKIQRMADQPGVEDLGSLAQDDLAVRLRGAGVWVHPSWYTPSKEAYYEPFGIAAAEAAAAGCVLVMSPWGGLTERVDLAVEHRFVEEYEADAWVDAIVAAIATARAGGPFLAPWPLDPSWGAVAEQISGLIDALAGAPAPASAG